MNSLFDIFDGVGDLGLDLSLDTLALIDLEDGQIALGGGLDFSLFG